MSARRRVVVLAILVGVLMLGLLVELMTPAFVDHLDAGLSYGLVVPWGLELEWCEPNRFDQMQAFKVGNLCFDWTLMASDTPSYVYEDNWTQGQVYYLDYVTDGSNIEYFVVSGFGMEEVRSKELSSSISDRSRFAGNAITEEQFDMLLEAGMPEITGN